MTQAELNGMVAAAKSYRERQAAETSDQLKEIVYAVAQAYGFSAEELAQEKARHIDRKLAARILVARLAYNAGISQAEIAAALGCERSNLSHMAGHLEVWIEAVEILAALTEGN